MDKTNKQIFDALSNCAERMIQRLQAPYDSSLLRLHQTAADAALRSISEAFLPALERRDLYRIHSAMLQVSRLACPVSESTLHAAKQIQNAVRFLTQYRKAERLRSVCRAAEAASFGIRESGAGEQALIQALQHLAQTVTETAFAID